MHDITLDEWLGSLPFHVRQIKHLTEEALVNPSNLGREVAKMDLDRLYDGNVLGGFFVGREMYLIFDIPASGQRTVYVGGIMREPDIDPVAFARGYNPRILQ